MDRTVRFGAMFGVVAAAVGVIDLQGGVVEVELGAQHGLNVGAHGVTVHPGGDQDVRRERLPGGDLPNVQIMEFGHGGDHGQSRADDGRVGVGASSEQVGRKRSPFVTGLWPPVRSVIPRRRPGFARSHPGPG